MSRFARMLFVMVIVAFARSTGAMELSGADGLIDFDSIVGFSEPKSISVFRSADPGDHLYFIVPNSIRLQQNLDKTPEFSLFHRRSSAVKEGYATFSLKPFIDAEDLEAIVSGIRAADSQAVFGVPQPIMSSFYITGPEMGTTGLTNENDAGNPLLTKSAFSVPVSSIAVRASLLPASYKFPIFTIGHVFVLKGTSRDSQGVTQVIQRKFVTSFVMYGVCALSPNWSLTWIPARVAARSSDIRERP